MILYSFNKYKLFSFFFIFLFSTSNYFINETFYPNNESQIISLNNYSQKLVLNESTEKSKISDNNLNPNKRCFQTDNKIYWKNQIDLELEKSKKEIENSNLLKISFDNKEDFFKRENPKISLIITTLTIFFFELNLSPDKGIFRFFYLWKKIEIFK